MATPQGGPRDSLPPVVVRTTPAPYTTKFNGKKISIEFNEYIQLKEQQKYFFVSPPGLKKPTLTVKGKGVEVVFQEDLTPETTYRLDFGSSIRDNNEGNPLYGYSYVFSTGDVIDSLVMVGQTVRAYERDTAIGSYLFFFDEKEDSTTIDSTLFRGKADAMFRSDSSGYFVADILKDKRYRIYALDDTNGDQKYQAGTDLVAFLDETFNPAELDGFTMTYDSVKNYMTIDNLQAKLELFKEIPLRRQSISKQERPLRQKIVFVFNTPNPVIDSLNLKGIDPQWLIREDGMVGDTITYWIAPPTKENIKELVDTIRGVMVLQREDSVWQPYMSREKMTLTHRIIESKREMRERLQAERQKAAPATAKKNKKNGKRNKITNDTLASKLDTINRTDAIENSSKEKTDEIPINPFSFRTESSTPLNPTKHVSFNFAFPLRTIDSSRIELHKIETTEQRGKREQGSTPQTRSVKVPFTLSQTPGNIRRWVLRADWVEDQEYSLMIPSGVFEDITFEKNDTLTSKFKVANPDKFGTIVLSSKADSSDMSTYIYEILQGSSKHNTMIERIKGVKPGDKITVSYLNPGSYTLRIIQDINNNGKWDTGSLTERRQPEKVRMYLDENSTNKHLISKERWTVEEELDLKKIFE